MTHRNAVLTPQGRYRLVMRVQAGRPIAHVAAEAGIARAIDVIVYIARRATSRKVEEVLAIDGWDREKGEYITHRLDG